MVSHRGVLSEEEYELLDWDAVEAAVLRELGTTLDEVEFAYATAPGPPNAERISTRRRIDARLLEASEAGGNMSVLCAVLGWEVRDDGWCQKMSRAIARAKSTREAE